MRAQKFIQLSKKMNSVHDHLEIFALMTALEPLPH